MFADHCGGSTKKTVGAVDAVSGLEGGTTKLAKLYFNAFSSAVRALPGCRGTCLKQSTPMAAQPNSDTQMTGNLQDSSASNALDYCLGDSKHPVKNFRMKNTLDIVAQIADDAEGPRQRKRFIPSEKGCRCERR